jgi:DNA-binding CsgD family transcriptional regulator
MAIAGWTEVAVEVAGIASRTGGVGERAEAMLDQLRRVIPFEGAWIGLRDPHRNEHLTVAHRGLDKPIRDWLAGPAVTAEIELAGLHRGSPPMRLRDLPFAPTKLTSWMQYLRPAGFRESIGAGLFTRDGRHLGVLALHTDTRAHPTDAARDLIGMLAPVIADAVDPLRSIASAARLVHNALGGIVVTRSGEVLPLPGLPPHPLLAAGSALLAVAASQLRDANPYTAFLCPYSEPVAPAGYVQIRVLACAHQPLDHLLAAVVVVGPPDLCGLTRRELEILGLLIDGWTNRRIATVLFITERTVAAHVEHILAKLDAPTRTLAAVRALRQGLYLPRALHTHPPSARRRAYPLTRGS